MAVGKPDDLCKKAQRFPSTDGADAGRDKNEEEGGGERESKALLSVNERGEVPKRQRSGRRTAYLAAANDRSSSGSRSEWMNLHGCATAAGRGRRMKNREYETLGLKTG